MGAYADYLKFERMTPEQQKRHIKAIRVVCTFLMGLWLLIGAICLAARGHSTDCIRFLQWSLIPIGLAFFAIFFVGCCGVIADEGGYGLRCLYLVFSFFAILAFVIFMLFSFVAVGVVTKDKPVHDYELSNYKGWLRGRLSDTRYWATVSSCLRDRHACDGMKHLVRDPDTSLLVPDEKDSSLSPIQSGCCKPPSSCAFTYVNGTMWTTTSSAPAVVKNDDDCSRWSDDQQMLCFQCDSCKAGVLEDIKKGWTGFAIWYTILAIVLVCAYPCQVMEFMEADGATS